MMTRFARSTVAALTIAFVLPAAGEEAVQLRQAWQVGKRYTQSMKMEQSTNISMAGKNVSQAVEMTRPRR
jgi:hypothetical protein